MNNYITALQKFLQEDPEISAIVGDRVAFLRMPQGVTTPYIIFNEQTRSPDLLNQHDYTSGVDAFPILIDVIVSYEQVDIGRTLRHKIREKIGNFNGVLAGQREGIITFREFLACDYNVDTDGVMWGGLYLFKQYR